MSIVRASIKSPAPTDRHDRGLSTACSLAEAVAAREISAVDLTEAALSRLGEVGPRLSALAWLNDAQARRDAASMDLLAEILGRKSLETHPLLGLPITVKEGLRVAGAPWMMGSSLSRNRIAREDGTVVARLRAAGAVIVGLGAMAERALWPETVNKLTGRALHPQDPQRTPGGSSGGDAALVAARAVTAAVGTDGGGSVRIPAAYCGLYAHKPSASTVPLTGHVPMDCGPDHTAAPLAQFFTPGPITRHPADLWPLLSVMAGSDGIQQGVDAPLSAESPSASLLSGRTVYVLSNPRIGGVQRADAAQVMAVEAAAQTLQKQGATLQIVRDDLLVDAFAIWAGTLRCAADCDMEHLLGNGKRIGLLNETVAQLFGRGRHTGSAIFLALISRFDLTGPRTWRRWSERGERLKAELSAMLAPDAVMLCPPVPGAAPRHNSAFRHPFNVAPCAVFNALGNPATVAPVLLGPEGLPRAVQIVARHGADHLTISAALALARANLPNLKKE